MVIESIPKAVGMAYAIAASLVVVLLFRRGKFNKRIGYLLLILSTVLGFLVFAPMLPSQFQSLLLGKTQQLGVPVEAGILVLSLFIVLAFVFGRAFCGHACPVGAVQELAYLIPARKLKIKSNILPRAFSIFVLVVFLVLAKTLSIGVLSYLGVRDFFYLSSSSLLFLSFLALLIVSIFVYRPFCRFLCPYGALLSLVAIKSRFKIRRNDNCIDCGECEEACPTHEAGRGDGKQECYMCHRCIDVCPAKSIDYK